MGNPSPQTVIVIESRMPEGGGLELRPSAQTAGVPCRLSGGVQLVENQLIPFPEIPRSPRRIT
jgi:hypothetical protein